MDSPKTKSRKTALRVIQVIGVLAAGLVAVSSVVLAVREGSWEPIAWMGWLPAVIIATWPRPGKARCWPRRRAAR